MKIFVSANFVRKTELSSADFKEKLTKLKEEALENTFCLSYDVMVGDVVAFVNEEWIAAIPGNGIEISEKHKEILEDLKVNTLFSSVVFDGIRNKFESAFRLEEIK